MTTPISRHIHATFGAIILMLLLLATLAWLSGHNAKATTKTPFTTVTNFVCEIRGELSNEHFHISSATRMTYAQWRIRYADNGTPDTYLQRPGEACRTETYTCVPNATPSSTGTEKLAFRPCP